MGYGYSGHRGRSCKKLSVVDRVLGPNYFPSSGRLIADGHFLNGVLTADQKAHPENYTKDNLPYLSPKQQRLVEAYNKIMLKLRGAGLGSFKENKRERRGKRSDSSDGYRERPTSWVWW